MPTFKVAIIANGDAANWTSWDAKIAALRDFYSTVCTLDITLVKTSLKPVFTPFEPGIYQVDPAWYDTYVLPLAQGADIAMFVVPPSDHTVPCLGGLESGQTNGIWKTTVFSDESSTNYVNGVSQGNNEAVVGCHELSHALYAMITGVNGGPNDHTHLYFYGGNPKGVLTDLNFASCKAKMASLTALYQKLIPVLNSLVSALTNKNMPNKATLSNLAGAIRDYEGAPGDLNYLLNNPIDARPSPDGYLPKYEPVEIVDTDTDPVYPYHKGKFAKFRDYDTGWLYANNLLRLKIENHPNWTLYQLFADPVNGLSPASDQNDPTLYSQFVGRRLGVDAATYQIKNIQLS